MTIAVDLIENLSEVQTIIRSILIANAHNGATIQEIRDQYYDYTGDKFPSIENVTEFLLQIKGIMCYVNENGTRIFNLLTSEKSQHILSMVKNQKPQKTNHRNNFNTNNNNNDNDNKNHPQTILPAQPHVRLNSINETDNSSSEANECVPNNTCFFKNNYRYFSTQNHKNLTDKLDNSWSSRQIGTTSSTASSVISTCDNNQYHNQEFFDNFFKEKRVAHLYDYQLMGDDFFLSMAQMELGCKVTKGQTGSRSGLCISGLTIRRAIKLVNALSYICPNIIINIGSVDILNGRDLVDIEYDFRNLKKAFINRGIKPIFTTLAPLGNFGHKSERYIIERFNKFIKRNLDIHVIDLWPCMVNQQSQTLYECYQSTARYVTGSDQPHVLWNKLGRQRILKKIKSEIELLPF